MRSLVAAFLTVFGLGLAALYGFVVMLDPYDRGGPFPPFITGVADEDARTAAVSRGRNPAFDSVVIGNSHGQLIDPRRLSAATGHKFVQLTIPGAMPREQMIVLDWFIGHHAHIGAIVVTGDRSWCSQDATSSQVPPFPFWLYSADDLEYFAHLLSGRSVERAWRRLLLALGLRTPSDPSGYSDYELGRQWAFRPAPVDGWRPASVEPRTPEIRFP